MEQSGLADLTSFCSGPKIKSDVEFVVIGF